jgi:hypothetical protein
VRSPLPGVALGAWVALAACSQGAAPPDPKLWTLFDVEALYAGGAPASHGLAGADGLPGGIPLGEILEPAGRGLVVTSTLTDGYLSTYVTTEVWSNFDRVWMQPMYVPVVGWQDDAPQPLRDGAGHWQPIFSVGPGSGFYSPFWQTVYVDVPPATTAGALTSARQILAAGYTLHPLEGRVMSLRPADIGGLANASSTDGGPRFGAGWLDGVSTPYLDFGPSTFEWDQSNVVLETPLYLLLLSDAGGTLHGFDLQTVSGSGPPGSDTQPKVDDLGKPLYGSYWRVYTAVVPPGARVFAPPPSDLYDALTAAGVPMVKAYSADILAASAADLAPFVGRVAVNPGDPDNGVPGCFDTADQVTATANGAGSICQWIDSQAKIEGLDPRVIEKTGITLTAPFVDYHGDAVGPP